MYPQRISAHVWTVSVLLSVLLQIIPFSSVQARTFQDPVTGAFTGRVSSANGDTPVQGAIVEITNTQTGFVHRRKTDAQGNWRQDLLPPAIYEISVSASGFAPEKVRRDLYATEANSVIPVPVVLKPVSNIATQVPGAPAPVPSPTQSPVKVARAGGQAVTPPQNPSLLQNRVDVRRGGNFTAFEASAFPLGSRTLVRTFDELAFLLPGVALPPQSSGNVEGPGVGAGLGTAGQFVVNGFSGRTNNFMVDGSDNNDEEVGVRRQGFMTPVPQTIESISQYSVMTLHAPASFGRNIGAQVNVISRRGESNFHGTIYGFFNSSALNARNFFDTANGTGSRQLTAGSNQPVVLTTFAGNSTASGVVSSTPFTVRNQSGDKESFTLGQFGGAIGGPISKKVFFFFAAERQILNANEERSFIVPTVEQRGVFGTGATGLFRNPFTGAAVSAIGETRDGAAVFSLFPFPNNPTGPFGVNTYTAVLPASGKGTVFSGRVDADFKGMGGEHSLAARYNFTDDDRIIPATGGALFSSVRPLTRTNNFSTYLNTIFGNEQSARPSANQLRFSYGTTSLRFQEVRDPFLVPSTLFPNVPFLLNAPYLVNATLPAAAGTANAGPVTFARFPNATNGLQTTETALGPLGRVSVAGFSPVGVDVSSLPQRRDTATIQVADVYSFPFKKRFYFTVGGDIRPIHLDSDMASNSRTELNFGSVLICTTGPCGVGQTSFLSSLDAAALGAASSSRLSLARASTQLNLRYTQYNVFGQTEIRLRPNLTIYLGLRYEYNSPIKDANNRIESAYSDPNLALVPFLQRELSGKTSIFDSDLNNFAPRLGLVYSHRFFGEKTTVVRFGYGQYFDQILGAAVTRARNIFPNFVVANFPGGLTPGTSFRVFNPYNATLGGVPVVQPGTLNTFNPNASLSGFVNALNTQFPGAGLDVFLPNFSASENSKIRVPVGNHLSAGIEQQVGKNTILTAAYVGTFGAYLLAPITPYGGNNSAPVLTSLSVSASNEPSFQGFVTNPRLIFFPSVNTATVPPGAVFSLGGLNFSRYDSAQFSLRGRLLKGMNYNIAYTLSSARDESSDFVDTAHSPALAQCSFCGDVERKAFLVVPYFTNPGEYGPSDFDSRHRISYGLIYDLPAMRDESGVVRAIFGNLQISSLGEFQSGRPFTINTVNDINLDGNLTDRLNTTSGIVLSGNGSQPVTLSTTNTRSLLAPLFRNGAVDRNTLFRGANYINLNLAVTKSFSLFGGTQLRFRTEFFNLLNRANFGMPERYIESPGFGRTSNTISPGRRVQFSLKYAF